jgi:hypothetical protein
MTTSTPNLPFGAQLIGRTEKSLGAVLDRVLIDSGLTEAEYVALRVCSDQAGSQRTDIEVQLSAVFRQGHGHAEHLLDRLTSNGIIEVDESGSLRLSGAGIVLRDGIARQTSAITERLWGDLPAADLAVAARILSTVLERAADERA